VESSDMSELLQKFKATLDGNPDAANTINDFLHNNSKDTQDDSPKNTPNVSSETINNIVSMLNKSNESKKSEDNDSKNTSEGTSNNNFDFNSIDMETLMKMKSIMDKMNSSDDANSKLISSLKPYLKESRRSKVDQYMQFFKLSKVMGTFTSSEKGGKNGI
jgi:hypothetical protein